MITMFEKIWDLLGYSICNDQFSIWLSYYQSYAVFAAIANAVVLFVMRSALGSTDYRKIDLLMYQYSGANKLMITSLLVYVFMTIVLLLHSSIEQTIWVIPIFALLIIFVIGMLISVYVKLHRATILPIPIEELARKRIITTVKNEYCQTRNSKKMQGFFREEIIGMHRAIIESVINRERRALASKMDWIVNIYFRAIDDITMPNVETKAAIVGITSNTIEDVVREVCATQDKIMIRTVLEKTEEIMRIYICSSDSESYGIFMGYYLRTVRDMPNEMVLRTYIEGFQKNGRVIDYFENIKDEEIENFIVLIYNELQKLAGNFILQEVYETEFIDISEAMIGLEDSIYEMRQLASKEYGIGFWLYAKALLRHVACYNPSQTMQRRATNMYSEMNKRVEIHRMEVRRIEMGIDRLIEVWGEALTPSLFDSWDALLSNRKLMGKIYTIEEALITITMYTKGTYEEKRRVVEKILHKEEKRIHQISYLHGLRDAGSICRGIRSDIQIKQYIEKKIESMNDKA